MFDAKAGLLGMRLHPTRQSKHVVVTKAEQDGGIRYMSLLGSQNAIGKTSQPVSQGTQTTGTSTDTKFIKPSTSTETQFKPTKHTSETTFVKPPEKQEFNLVSSGKVMEFFPLTPREKKVSLDRNALDKAVAKMRDSTQAPPIPPPFNLPQESKAQTAWADYVKTRYGADAGRLESDYVKADQVLYESAKDGWKEAVRLINEFKYLEKTEGGETMTGAEEEARANFGAFILNKVGGFVLGKLNGRMKNSIKADDVAQKLLKELAGEFMNGIQSGLQYLTNLNYKDTIGDLQRFQHELFKFNPAWRISFRRQLDEETKKASPAGDDDSGLDDIIKRRQEERKKKEEENKRKKEEFKKQEQSNDFM